ncbi:hypothetical protein ACLQ8Z_02255 [Bordetella hinzii]|uniref:hypothetical protein n=1 Tax=Bordetella hinzii TaxID=103855 RepID=UPI0011514B4D|nr:hypothetical protein [Bordetella hinzii]
MLLKGSPAHRPHYVRDAWGGLLESRAGRRNLHCLTGAAETFCVILLSSDVDTRSTTTVAGIGVHRTTPEIENSKILRGFVLMDKVLRKKIPARRRRDRHATVQA